MSRGLSRKEGDLGKSLSLAAIVASLIKLSGEQRRLPFLGARGQRPLAVRLKVRSAVSLA